MTVDAAERQFTPPMHPNFTHWMDKVSSYVRDELGYSLNIAPTDNRYDDYFGEPVHLHNEGVTTIDRKWMWVKSDAGMITLRTLIHETGHAMMEKKPITLEPLDVMLSSLIGILPRPIHNAEVKTETFTYIIGKELGVELGYTSARMSNFLRATPSDVDKIADVAMENATKLMNYINR
jgi:hypothetical protein